MIKNNIIIFIILFFLILHYCDNIKKNDKLELDINKMKDNFANTQNISITESIKNLGILAKKIKDVKNSVYTLPVNVDVFGDINVGSSMNFFKKGTIVMWNKDKIPEGWVECNGQDVANFGKVPDLRGRFILGAGNAGDSKNKNNIKKDGEKPLFEHKHIYKINDTGGSRKHSLHTSEMPSHHHRLFGNGRYDGWIQHGSHHGFQGSSTKNNNGVIDTDTFAWVHGGDAGYTKIYNTGGPVNDIKHSLRQPYSGNKLGSVQSHHNIPPYYVLKYIIKVY